MKTQKNKPVGIYMKYWTYTYLRSHILQDIETEHNNYMVAHDLIGKLKIEDDIRGYPITQTYNPYKEDKRAADQIWNNYKTKVRLLNQLLTELDYAYSKSAHPNMIATKGFFKTK